MKKSRKKSPVAKATKKTTKKATQKKAAKKVSPKKAEKAAQKNSPTTKAKLMDEKKVADRNKAKAIGLGLIHYRVLRALAKNPKIAEHLSYRDIEKLTGYYSILAGILHTDEEYSLVSLGLAKIGKEEQKREVTIFSITAKGRKLLKKAG